MSNRTSTASGSEAVGGGTLHQSWRARANALDLQLYRRLRSLARTPEHVRDVRRFSQLGEHGAVWLFVGAGGVALDGGNRSRWLRATAAVAVAYACSTSIKLVVGRKRPAVEDLPHLMATPTGLSFPSSHSTSSFAAAQAFGRLLPRGRSARSSPARRCRSQRWRWRSAASTSASITRPTSPPARCSGP